MVAMVGSSKSLGCKSPRRELSLEANIKPLMTRALISLCHTATTMAHRAMIRTQQRAKQGAPASLPLNAQPSVMQEKAVSTPASLTTSIPSAVESSLQKVRRASCKLSSPEGRLRQPSLCIQTLKIMMEVSTSM